MDLLKVTQSTVGEWSVVSARGEVDVASSPSLSQHMEEAIGAAPRVLVDLSGVSFLDSTGLGVLVQALNASKLSEGQLRVVISDPNVLKVFEMTSLDGVFDIYDSVERATSGA